MNNKESKTVSASETIATQVVCPNDTNPMGILLGGRLVEWMDMAAAVCAQLHAEKICVTASIDSMDFKAPVRLGDIISITAKVTRTFTSSMEIFVQAYSRNAKSDRKILVNEAYFTLVALDENARPVPVPVLNPVTEDELNLYNSAGQRKEKKRKSK